MKLKAFIEKNYLRINKYLIAGPRQKYYYKGRYPTSQKIVFYLCNKEVIHLGDTLWFEPIVRFLSQHYDVAVCPTPPMQFYFIKLGYKVINVDDITDDYMLVASRELMYKLRRYKNVLFLNFDYALLGPGEKLINNMVKSAAKFFNLSCEGFDMKYQKLKYDDVEKKNILTKFNLDANSKYMVFSNYIDSWGRSTTIEMLRVCQSKLIDRAREFKDKNPDIQLLYVGSKHDLRTNQIIGDIGDFIDLRGQTEVPDLFLLGAIPQVVGYMGFDTFWLHLFNMYNKPSYILLKPGHPAKIDQLIVEHVLVPYTNGTQVSVNLL
ncbi:MAG: hypothetical protein K0R14_1798 [Burkholderiales bacterium]|jgi:hypothetical protein|nr:hypothetical protein [Burkholderiales bacterium]